MSSLAEASVQPVAVADRAQPLWRHPAALWTAFVAAILVATAPLWWEAARVALFELEFRVAAILPGEQIALTAWFLLPAVGLGAGLLASLSPCILPLVPLNLAYIGSADAEGWTAVGLSARFVLGAAAVLALLGLAGDLAGFLLIEQRGPVLFGAGLLMLYFGLAALEIAPVPFAGRALGGSRKLGAFGAGAAFSLVTTPCASPLLAAILTAASAQALPGLGVVSMIGFALGYTALVFLGGVVGGGLVRSLRQRSLEAPRATAGALLVVIGAGFAWVGIAWFV